jgi:hypothetical protein
LSCFALDKRYPTANPLTRMTSEKTSINMSNGNEENEDRMGKR